MAKVVSALQVTASGNSVPCYIADVSDQEGDLWDALAAWLIKEDRPTQMLMSGSGPVLCLQNGHVILHMLAPLQYDATTITAAIRSALSLDPT